MQKRAKTKDTWPGAWDSSCSGHVDAGEDYETAALRELDEELGWQPDDGLEFLFLLRPSEETGQEFIKVYRSKGDGPFRLNLDEIEIGEWMNIPNLLERVEYTPKRFSSAFRVVLERLKALELLPA
ncbi:MAG: NUDIX domain-containing protein [Verrucomicrobiota bacterium]